MPKVNFAGLKLKNPVIVASATPSISAEKIKKAADAGAGAVVTKSVVLPEKNGKPAGAYPKPRFMLMNNSGGYDPVIAKKNGFFSFFRLGEPYPTPEEMISMLDTLKKPGYTDIPIIVSICGAPNDYESWVNLAKSMENAGADALELNMHCWPVIKYTDPMIVKAVKDVVNIPVIVKLMAINDNPEIVAPQVELAGADAITGLGTFGFRAMEIDVESGKPYLGTFHGLGGSWLRSVSLAYMAKVRQKVTIPISGVTGVHTWEDAVKYMLIGASTVQVCGAIYAHGYKVLSDIANGIDNYMEKHNYKTIEDFKGKALSGIKVPEYNPPVIAKVDDDKCTGCTECADVCLFDAISIEGRNAKIDPEACDGCGVC
ncbi:MAG: 4Fe-4S binding protein [Firmicutes bacterium]|nr:4Fe-4S binding protein [Bacillota bacterium]